MFWQIFGLVIRISSKLFIVNNMQINAKCSQARWCLKTLRVREYTDVSACDREKAVVERWRWPKWQRQIEISKGYHFLSAKVSQAITWHIDLYPLRQTLPQKELQPPHPRQTHTHTYINRSVINLLPASNYYCFAWKSCGLLRSLRSWPLK